MNELEKMLADMGLPDEAEAEANPEKETRSRTMTKATKSRRLARRAKSEMALLDALPRKFEKGWAYHCITRGDVDALSYLKAILRRQPLDYLLFATWCMTDDDCDFIAEALEREDLKEVDAYVGEIFPGSYAGPYRNLQQTFSRYKCGRICVSRNHSKVFAGRGPDFAFVVETSANINTNPRTEQGVITIDEELFEFYKATYDSFRSFTKGDDYRKGRAKK